MKLIDTATGRFGYIEAGDAGAPLVLCLHGFPDHAPSFVPLMERIAAAGYRAIAPWMRGYNPSVREGPYDIDQLGADAVALADALSPGRPVVLVGHDWGALATYAAAALRPDRFRCAVTMAVPHPLAVADNAPDHPGQLRRSWYVIFFQLPLIPERVVSDRVIDKLWRDWSPGFALGAAARADLLACLAASMPAPIEYYRALVRPLGLALQRLRRPASELRIRVPLLWLHGATDGCMVAGMGSGAQRFFDGPYESELLDGVGHFMQLEDPDRVSSCVQRWLTAHAQR